MAKSRNIQPRKRAIQPRAQVTVEAILRATAHILTHDGYDRASTNRIAERAGVSIGSLYQYFPSKESLLLALRKQHIDEMRAVLHETARTLGDETLEGTIRAFVSAMLRAHSVDPALHRVLHEQTPALGDSEERNALGRDALALARTYLATRRDLGPKNLDLPAFITVHVVEALTHAAVLHHPEHLVSPAFVDEVVALVTRYLQERAPLNGDAVDVRVQDG
jgi:AcrR family transcriptional regulator